MDTLQSHLMRHICAVVKYLTRATAGRAFHNFSGRESAILLFHRAIPSIDDLFFNDCSQSVTCPQLICGAGTCGTAVRRCSGNGLGSQPDADDDERAACAGELCVRASRRAHPAYDGILRAFGAAYVDALASAISEKVRICHTLSHRFRLLCRRKSGARGRELNSKL